jgi:hypothetical protein
MNAGDVPTLFVRPSIRHELAVALRFVDAFTRKPIDVPLDVRATTLPLPLPAPPARPPNVPWVAIRRPDDATYRFLVSDGETMPTGPLEVIVTDRAGAYANLEPQPLTILLPRPLVAHPPTPDRSDFLVEPRLWPTRRIGITPGETVVVGRVVSAGTLTPIDRLRIRLGVSPLPADPFTYTNDVGEFLFRLPGLKGRVVGTVVTSTASLDIEMLQPPAYTTSVSPSSPAFPFVVNLGEVTLLEIQVP